MSRLIDADEMIADLYDEEKHSAFMAPFKLCTADRVDLKFLLNEAPTVDAVPVVRCGECVHYCLHDAADGKYCEILRYESPIESGWCCYGERSADNAE